MPLLLSTERMGTWDIQMEDGRWVEREGYTFLLTDRITASSGETAVEFLHTVENTLTVGIPTSGCSLGVQSHRFYLPNTAEALFWYWPELQRNHGEPGRGGLSPRPVGQPRRGPGGGGPAVRVLWPEGAGFVGAAASAARLAPVPQAPSFSCQASSRSRGSRPLMSRDMATPAPVSIIRFRA